MAVGMGKLTELRLDQNGYSGRIACPPGLRPAPGQYITAVGPDPFAPLPAVLFPTRYHEDEIDVAPPLPAGWEAGMTLTLRGPLGNGFRMPPTTRRMALARLDGPPARLMPLAAQALEKQAAVAIYTDTPPAGLSEDVEVLPLDMLPEAHSWADFLALEVPLQELASLPVRIGLQPYQRLACATQVLVITSMPCSGAGACGVCAVSTNHGWALACTDGPVFDFHQLEGGK